MGWTQHTVGAQNIRAMSMIQLLLGNIGVAGGGVNALRGESNVQGSTDHCLLYHIWPGYLKSPQESDTSLAALNGGYHAAFFLGALFAALATVLGAALLRVPAAARPADVAPAPYRRISLRLGKGEAECDE